MAQRIEEERSRSLTGKMLPGDGINEVRHSYHTKMIREYQTQCSLSIRNTQTCIPALPLSNIRSHAPTYALTLAYGLPFFYSHRSEPVPLGQPS
jgi:hypothetical protein